MSDSEALAWLYGDLEENIDAVEPIAEFMPKEGQE